MSPIKWLGLVKRLTGGSSNIVVLKMEWKYSLKSCAISLSQDEDFSPRHIVAGRLLLPVILRTYL